MFDTQFCNLTSSTVSILRASNAMDSTLLITGSTGTGKSHLAHAIHRASSKRGSGRWFKVNLATLSESLIESELFGHERGAFTGADSRRLGRLEACNGGTVFLDEIGELPLRLQAKLLDFIQYKKICPVGSNREIELDVRIIAATNRNLEAAVRSGEFRADLFHRLNVFHVRMPDLSLNPRAAVQFAKVFAEARARESGKSTMGLSREVEQVFRHYTWPGNIRELQNIIEFAVAMEGRELIQVSSLPNHLQEYARERMHLSPGEADQVEGQSEPAAAEQPRAIKVDLPTSATTIGYLQVPMTLDFHESKMAFEKAYLLEALNLCGGQINLTSRRIGLNKVSLTDKIRKYAIDWRKIRYEALVSAPSFKQDAQTAL